jgi:hypothetical protein
MWALLSMFRRYILPPSTGSKYVVWGVRGGRVRIDARFGVLASMNSGKVKLPNDFLSDVGVTE